MGDMGGYARQYDRTRRPTDLGLVHSAHHHYDNHIIYYSRYHYLVSLCSLHGVVINTRRAERWHGIAIVQTTYCSCCPSATTDLRLYYDYSTFVHTG